MNRFFIVLIAGLCLAILSITGCNGGITAPPVITGEVTVTDDGDERLISNEPVVLAWDPVSGIDHYVVEYSTNGNDTWLPIGETKSISMDWKIPKGTDSDNFLVRADGYSNVRPAPQSRSISVPKSVIPYGELVSYFIDAPAQSNNATPFVMDVTAKDQYSNTIINFAGEDLQGTFSVISAPPLFTLAGTASAFDIGTWTNGSSSVTVVGGINGSWWSDDHSSAVIRITMLGVTSLITGYDDIELVTS